MPHRPIPELGANLIHCVLDLPWPVKLAKKQGWRIGCGVPDEALGAGGSGHGACANAAASALPRGCVVPRRLSGLERAHRCRACPLRRASRAIHTPIPP
jgi:hypothetical protein